MRDLRDVIGFYIDLCEQCNPPQDVLELESHPDTEQEMDAYIRPEMLHHSCALRVSIPHGAAQDEVITLLEDMAARLRNDPTWLESVWQAEPQEAEESEESQREPDPRRHMH